jgi:hypothetical protein
MPNKTDLWRIIVVTSFKIYIYLLYLNIYIRIYHKNSYNLVELNYCRKERYIPEKISKFSLLIVHCILFFINLHLCSVLQIMFPLCLLRFCMHRTVLITRTIFFHSSFDNNYTRIMC